MRGTSQSPELCLCELPATQASNISMASLELGGTLQEVCVEPEPEPEPDRGKGRYLLCEMKEVVALLLLPLCEVLS